VTQQWLERWQEGRTGWHEEEGNASLKKHWQGSGHTVLVPLCGKSVDLVWIAAQGNRVIGVELSEIAVEAFFEEQQMTYSKSDGTLSRYEANDVDITIYCGDFFALTSLQCDAHYDRGALIALRADLRPAYAAHVSSLLSADARQLVITLNYDDTVAAGPPFSVEDSELLSYWPQLACVETRDDIDNAPPKFIDDGLDELLEKVWCSG
jgi:thiopurine S-methyltransferase